MKIQDFCRSILAASLLLATPALAQSPAASNPSVQKQKTDGADNPSNPREYQGAAEWHKQHTDGADNPSNPREYQGAAEWHKQHTQSMSHVDGSPSGVAKQN
jgi:hypothetical protein